MLLTATDRMACPRCGPEFGLILMADRLEERRVLEGRLGCPNCREHYPIRGGMGDLRPPPRPEPEALPTPPPDDPEGAVRTAAFLGVTEGPGLLLLAGAPAGRAERIAAMISGIEVVAVGAFLGAWEERPGVTRIIAGNRIPFYSGSLRGVALDGAEAPDRLDEGVRVLAPGARLVVHHPPPETLARVEGAGMEALLQTPSVIVAAKGG